jgi:hypothetical protein
MFRKFLIIFGASVAIMNVQVNEEYLPFSGDYESDTGIIRVPTLEERMLEFAKILEK